MRRNRQNHGFSLIEALIVMVLMIGAVTISLSVLATAQREQRRTALVNEQATEMARLTTATKSYLRTAEGLSETEGEIFAIAPADLIAAGLLPADFAKRPASGTNVPVSPMGQVYSVTAALTPDGYRALVVPTGTPNPGFLARAGVANTAQDILEYSAAVMQRMRQQFEITSSVISKDTKTVDSAVSGYSYDLTSFLSAAPAVPTVVGMANFSELDMKVDDNGGGGGENRSCELTVDEACPAGSTESWTYTTCEEWGPEHMDSRSTQMVSTAGGVVSISRGNTQGAANGPPPTGGRNFRHSAMLKQVSTAVWSNPQFDAFRSSIQSTSPCSGTMVEYKPYNLHCPSTGDVLNTWYEPVCGDWYWAQPEQGELCAGSGWQFSPHEMYQAGLTNDLRISAGIGIGGPVIPHQVTFGSLVNYESDPVVRTLPVCEGSTNTIPIPVQRADLGGGKAIEYMGMREGTWYETVNWGDATLGGVRLVLLCAQSILTPAPSYSSALVPGVVATNACPNQTYRYYDGSTTVGPGYSGVVLERDDSKKRLRMCCS